MQRQTTCQKCHNRIQAGRRLCASCRKHSAATSARVARPDVARVLARSYPVASSSFYAPRVVTTSDILALKNKSLISASPREFMTASELAWKWNEYLKAATQ